MYVIAHLSDPHFDGGPHSLERAERVMAYLNGLARPVDVVLVTGDIAEHGRAGEYEDARKTLVAPVPVLICPGNHDDRAAFRENLLGEPASDRPVNQVFHEGPAVFAVCDTSIPGRDDGRLDDETIEWLDEVLDQTPDEVPVFVCFHHPPVPLGPSYVDEIRQRGEHRLAEVLHRHPGVLAVLCGHAHTAAATTFAGHPLLVAPAIASTVRLPWEHGGVIDHRPPPALALHLLHDDGRLTTHYRAVL